ncbi:MAG: TetR/AcrR family transcriptional regulator [Clostridia bacterium]|nr:TetR/AcrR family transcriptional regulator [Clostridia bacterium]
MADMTIDSQQRKSNEEASRLTRECMETALLLLLKQKPLHEISVTELTRKAGVSRNAYYRHFDSIDSILRSLARRIAGSMVEAALKRSSDHGWEGYWQVLFEEITPYAEVFMLLHKSGCASAILDGINAACESILEGDDLHERLRQRFWNGAMFNILTEWIREGMEISPAEMAQICARLP